MSNDIHDIEMKLLKLESLVQITLILTVCIYVFVLFIFALI